jgi:thymidylate kinase
MTSSGRGRLIVLIGPDGSGKSSISNRLLERLSSERQGVSRVWCRFESRPLGFALKMVSKMRGHEGDFRETYAARSESKSRLMTNSPMKWPYLVFVVASYMVDLHGKVAGRLKEGGVIISDRYIYDTIVDLWVDFGRKDAHLSFLIPLLSNIAPPPDKIFLVDVPEEVSMSRKDDVPNIEYVTVRRMGYERICQRIGAIKLDGAQPIDSNVERIYNEIR